MKKIITGIFLLITLGISAQEINWTRNFEKAYALAKEKNQNIYAFLTAPSWCVYCKKMDAETLSNPDVINYINKKFVPLKILDTDEESSRFPVRGWPTTFIINTEPAIVQAVPGFIQAGQIKHLFDKWAYSQTSSQTEQEASTVGQDKIKKIKWQNSFRQASQMATQQDKNIFFYFAPEKDCVLCKFLEENTFTRDYVMNSLNQDFIPAKISLEEAAAMGWEITVFPTVVISKADGTVLFSYMGPFLEKNMPLFERYAN